MKKLFIWGAGEIGKRIQNHLGNDWEVTFVDSYKYSTDCGSNKKMIISIEDYLDKYSDKFILIAHLQEEDSLNILKRYKIDNYFIHCNLPGEFKEPYVRSYLKNFVSQYLRGRTDYVLYGLDLYTIIVDTWIYKEYGIHPYIWIQETLSEKIVHKITEQYPGMKLVNDVHSLSGIKEICICSFNENEIKKQGVFGKYDITDIFDCTEKIKDYHNVQIKEIYNLHKGKRCFIIATGPSLKIEDLDCLKEKGELCISMNSIFHAFDRTDWRPDYYVMSDYRGFAEYQDLLDTLSVKKIFLSDNDENYWKVPHRGNIYRYHQHYEYSFNRLPKFSEDFSKRSYASSTVTYTCIQLAVYMGFQEIYLLGVDFSYGDSQKNVSYTHFYKSNKPEENGIGYVKHVTLAYESAKQYADTHGIKIYNATRGGKLEIFERVDFDSLF